MDRAKEKCVGWYQDKLDPVLKARYLDKIQKIGGVDPYEHGDWTRDLKALPPLTEAELVLYLVKGISYYTGDKFRNAKSLRTHGQANFGWVQDLRILRTVVISEPIDLLPVAIVRTVAVNDTASLHQFQTIVTLKMLKQQQKTSVASQNVNNFPTACKAHNASWFFHFHYVTFLSPIDL
ncbi:hypothetical protein ABVT39_020474 [Epinephelus coioides]